MKACCIQLIALSGMGFQNYMARRSVASKDHILGLTAKYM